MYCILITGMPASGKSVLAKRISNELCLPVLSKDAFKEVLFDTIGFNSREEKVKLGTSAMELMYLAAEELMKVNKPFILDNNFENSSYEGLMKLLNRYNYEGITLRLTGDPAVIYKRFTDRDLNTNRHRGHVVNDCYPEKIGAKKDSPSRKTYDQFINDLVTRGFDTFKANGPVIVVDVTNLENVDFTNVIKQIKEIIKAN